MPTPTQNENDKRRITPTTPEPGPARNTTHNPPDPADLNDDGSIKSPSTDKPANN